MSAAWQQFLLSRAARFDNGQVVSFGGAAALHHGAGVVDLSHMGIIEVNGADAAAFLHAQLTNDVLALPDGHAQWNGWCTPKGRLLVTFLMWREGGRYFLMLPKALQQATQKRLQMFVLRSKVTLRDASEDAVAFGLTHAGTPDLPVMTLQRVADHAVLPLSPHRALVLAAPASAAALWEHHVKTGVKESGEAAWRLAGIADCIYSLTPETQEQFVPQIVNFDLTGGVSFKKGCYPGQEIVARTQYRGILKRRMVRAECASALKPGDAVFAVEFGDQPAGQVADAVLRADGITELLVVAQIESIRAGSLRAANGAALNLSKLPYRVPELDAA
ncbi:MAG: folate-binding protein YgfZ [Betaproteobacteria bacterium]|nr:folate-binding protein YgfZ [Betaproteobacteria bacterium]